MLQEQTMELLLAEDDAGHARLIRNNLRTAGIQNRMHHFEDGQAVLNFLTEKQNGVEPVDFSRAYVLLLDIRMPKVSGDEVLRRIKEDPVLKIMPVIMLTTTDDPREVRRCHELGCNEYVTKPIDHEAFMKTIRSLGEFIQIAQVPPLQE